MEVGESLDPASERIGAIAAFLRQVVGLRIFDEYGDGSAVVGVVYFLGGGFLELSIAHPSPGEGVLDALAPGAGVKPGGDAPARPRRSPRGAGLPQGLGGLIELPVADPDGHAVILVEVPEDHFLRRQV